MIFTLTLILFLSVLSFFLGLFKRSAYVTETGQTRASGFGKLTGVVVVSLLLAIVNPIAIERIDSGHVGIKVDQTGNANGQSSIEYARGWVLYNSWLSTIYEFPVYQQHIDYEENTVITKGGFQTTIKPSFNYALNAGSVDDMFQNLRKPLKDVENGWLKNAIVSSVNDVANLYAVDSVFNHRAEFEAAIIKECNKRVSRWFTVSQLRTNIVPPDALRKSIEQKTQAIQEVQVAENQRQVAVAEAQRKIAQARGDSAKAVIDAAGRAEAIRREQLSLTTLYIEWVKAQKWDGAYPKVMSGSGGTILQLPLDK